MLREFRPTRGPISAEQLNEIIRNLASLTIRVRDLENVAVNPQRRILAKIKGYDSASSSYSFDEMEMYDGALRVRENGIEGRINGLGGWSYPTQNPAKELNGVIDVPTDTIVWMEPTAPSVEAGELPRSNYRFVYSPLGNPITKMTRIVEPVELHPTLAATYKAYVQRWNATTNELEDDYLIWLVLR
jgi:hypothetical protein